MGGRGGLFVYSYTNCQREEKAHGSGYYLKLRIYGGKKGSMQLSKSRMSHWRLFCFFLPARGSPRLGTGTICITVLQGASCCGRVNINTAHKESVWRIERNAKKEKKNVFAETNVLHIFE